MKDFIAEIKRINTDGVIFEFSKASIDMFQRQQYQKTFDVLSTRFDVQKKVGVPLSAWDIQDIAYLAVLHSNDYRRGKNLPQMGYLINLYRGYENANSIAEELRKSNIDRIFRAILGMSAEQFQYENINWIFEKFNRDYYILFKANSDYFINFNYTDTLERVYGISNVLHIHGSVPTCSQIPPIMGHGNKYLIDKNRAKATKYFEDSIEWACSIHNAIANFVESLYKDTDLIISRNEQFFSNLSVVDQIVTLGLSFGDVDVPYLERILSEIKPHTKWFVYYYSPEDKQRLKSVFGILGISRKYEVYFLHSDNFWDAL